MLTWQLAEVKYVFGKYFSIIVLFVVLLLNKKRCLDQCDLTVGGANQYSEYRNKAKCCTFLVVA